MANSSQSLYNSDVSHTLHPYTDLAAHEERGPLIISRGEGIYVWDVDGNKYIEGLAGLWCTGLGFSEPRLIDAAENQLRLLPFTHSFGHRACPPVIELAERLLTIAPRGLTKAYFVNSGSEAVDTAIKLVWYYNNALNRGRKKKIISRTGGYHGVTIASGSLTALPHVQNDFDLPIDRILHVSTPHYYRYGRSGESEEKFSIRLADELEELILHEGPETVGAFIAEPVMGSGGVLVPPKDYFEKVQRVLRRYDVLMIADEVICGLGRTGNMWGSDTYGIQPDMVTCAKQLSSGYLPIGALLINDDMYAALRDQSHRHGVFGTGNTYGGHPVAASVAVEVLKIYEERQILEGVGRIAPRFAAGLAELQEHELVGHSRSSGLLGGLELVANKETGEKFSPSKKASAVVVDRALANGLIVRGLPNDSIGICPPLIISEQELADLLVTLRRALDEAIPLLCNGS